jgi:putative N6-adenine-specific DNA methylase
MREMELMAVTLEGLEDVLSRELTLLGATSTRTLNRAVSFTGDKALLYRANLFCKCALRILKPVEIFSIHTEQQLYESIYSIAWENIFDADKSLLVRSIMLMHEFKNTHYFTLKAKDAIVDRLRDKTGKRPVIDKDHPQVVVHLFLHKDRLTVYLDSSAISLHKRGYRKSSGLAALNEVLAAGIFQLCDHRIGEEIFDPMCGSGTLGIEAALSVLQKSPHRGRRHFGFRFWNDFEARLWNRISRERNEDVENPQVHCSDSHRIAVEITKRNVLSAHLQEQIDCNQIDFFRLEGKPNALILLNPPYGERMRVEDINAFYKRIGDRLKQAWHGSRCAIISGNIPALHNIGLKHDKKVKLFNGQIPAELRIYSMYKGSLRTF